MRRRHFLSHGSLTAAGSLLLPDRLRSAQDKRLKGGLKSDLVILGGGLGGCAAALAALRQGLRVVLTEETDWIGGQLTSQGVPPDEHRWIETHGAPQSYRDLRSAIRRYYRDHYPLTPAARADPHFNPGGGSVSRLCCEPRVALAVLESELAPWRSGGQLTVLLHHRPIRAEVQGDRVRAVHVRNLQTGTSLALEGQWFLDATETGEVLPLAGVEFVSGAEGREATGELHAPAGRDPHNHQAFTVCFACDYRAGENHVIPPPVDYDFWRRFVPQLTPPWPGRLLDLTYSHPASLKPKRLGFHPAGATPGTLNLWVYRRIANPAYFAPATYAGGLSLINWPQNDYLPGNLYGSTEEENTRHARRGRELSLALLHWLQTEAPRPDGGQGWPGLRLRGDIFGTTDGLAKFPYVRESRRIRARFTVTEAHVGREQRAALTGQALDKVRAASFPDSVGIGSYHIDLHPSSAGDNYIDFPSLPFQIPLGALVPVRVRNLIPACKNIGTTHVTNGCYRLHPVEWNIGESAGHLVAFCRRHRLDPATVCDNPARLEEFQQLLAHHGVELKWPDH